MIKNIEIDKEKEYDFITKRLETIEKVINDSYIQQFLTSKEEYLNDLKWNMDHIDPCSRVLIKRLNFIINELIHHVQGFTLLIKNQDDLKLKEEMIECFLEKLKNNDLKLKELLF